MTLHGDISKTMLCSTSSLFYSKKIHGAEMLRRADPDVIQKNAVFSLEKSITQLKI